ncbi:MAG: anhydro-N-acetylmuramic acid kinase [Winogradskyella sp.]
MLRLNYNVIGVMSGTSLDGIDVVYANYKFNKIWSFEIINSQTISYVSDWKTRLSNLVELTSEDLDLIDISYTKLLADEIIKFKKKHDISKVDFIASHGHTALHQPEKGITVQIGNHQLLADLLNDKVICDFRVQDVKYGGQGAPLVPIGDRLLFKEYDYCLNLGGFANVSYEENDKRIAFDICPVNIVLNYYVSRLGLEYDNEGKIARTGNIHIELLQKLNQLRFYNLRPPKSLGLEWVQEKVLPLIDSYSIEVEDILRTFTEHIAIQISKVINKVDTTVLITGGGVYNKFLIERLDNYTSSKIVIPSNDIIEFKEALVFGFLGVLKDRNEVNCLRSVTGATKDHSSGKILVPNV